MIMSVHLAEAFVAVTMWHGVLAIWAYARHV